MSLYEDTPYRARMKQARPAEPPVPIQRWCYFNEKVEGAWPIVDDIKRGESQISGCDDPEPLPPTPTDRHQHPAIEMMGYDGVSDDGQEIFNFLEQEGRRNVVVMGVPRSAPCCANTSSARQ